MTTAYGPARQVSRASLAAPGDDVFLRMSGPARVAIIVFVLLYQLILPTVAASVHGDAGDLVVLRFLAETLVVGLTLLPFVVIQQGGGWLHPLFLPGVMSIAKAVFKNPMALFDPLNQPMVDFSVATGSAAASLRMSEGDLELTRLGLTLLYAAGLIIYYGVFFGSRRLSIPRIPFGSGSRVREISFVVVAVSVLAALALFQVSGGIGAYLVALRGGRQVAFAEIGPLLQVVTFSLLILTIWLMYERRPFLNPVFILATVSAMAVSLMATGSRSGIVIPAATLLLLWWKKRNRISLAPAIMAAVFAYAVVGGFGAIRQDYGNQTVNLAALNPVNAGEWFRSATTESARRGDAESDLAAFAGANRSGLLWGRTYVYAAAFWVPRGLWPDKPRAADSYNMWVNFSGHAISDPLPRAGEAALFGIPVTATVEAYWNFHILGVILLSIGMGLFHRSLVQVAKTYRHIPAVLPLVVYATLQFTGTSKEMVGLARDAAFLLPFLFLSGIMVWRTRGTTRLRINPARIARQAR